MLVNVEHGAANPSVGTLLKLSDALGVGLPSLVESAQPKAVKITRHGEGSLLWTGDAGGRGVLLVGTESPDVLELWEWTLGPGERHSSEAHAPGTKELLQVQEGAVALVVGEQTATLDAGDAIAFPGNVEHSYANVGSDLARFSLAVFEPSVGSTVPRAESNAGAAAGRVEPNA